MAQVINTNIASLNAQRNLNRSSDPLQTALKRISSGLRINSAKDDAAGLAIATRMGAQIRGLNQAARNANDAISLAQTAEGAMQEMESITQRMRELAVQSRNATNTSSDRTSLNSEFQQLNSELDRIASTTAFNGSNVLDGSMGTSVFQVGANVGETISVSLASSMRTNAIGQQASVSYTLQNDVNSNATDQYIMNAAGDVVIGSTNVGAATAGSNGKGAGSAYSIAAAITAGSATHGATATAGTTTLTVTAAEIAAFGTWADAGTADTLTYTMTLNSAAVVTNAAEGSAGIGANALAAAMNSVQATSGVLATVETNGDVTLTASDGRNIEIAETLGGSSNETSDDTVTGYFGNSLNATAATSDVNYDTTKTSISMSSSSNIAVSVAGASDELFTSGGPQSGGATLTTNAQFINAADILTASNADTAMNRIDQAITDMNVFRGTLGAIQNRFSSTIASLEATSENLSAARSRIMDADYATETANLTKQMILQQAGISVLSQANSLPQNVLALLQG